MDLDPVFLSRLQFAFTIGFHIIFPAFTIGLASFLAVLEGLWLTTKKAFLTPWQSCFLLITATSSLGLPLRPKRR